MYALSRDDSESVAWYLQVRVLCAIFLTDSLRSGWTRQCRASWAETRAAKSAAELPCWLWGCLMAGTGCTEVL